MKPVRLPAAATLALPRWSIIILCMLYIFPGLVGRAPWKDGDDAAGFGIMWTMANGGIEDWLWPHVVGLPVPDEGPLAFWVGAICIKLFAGLFGAPHAARLGTALAFAVGAWSLWYTTYLLGRRTEAQPLKLAFGGQPEPRDFGRTLADCALLIYLASFGLLVRSHETIAESWQVALIANVLYHLTRLFDTPTPDSKPQFKYAAYTGIILALLVLCRGWVLVAGLLLFLAALAIYRQQHRVLYSLLFLSIPLAIIGTQIWIQALDIITPFDSTPYGGWMQWNYRQFHFPSKETISYFIRTGIWFLWPAWPLATWAIYAWRRQDKALHISLPLTFIIAFCTLAICNPRSEESVLLPILPPLAILAAFALPTLKRGALNAIDWFAVTVLSCVAGLIWIGWIAEQFAWPENIAAKLNGLAPGYIPTFNGFIFAFSILISALWIWLVKWRTKKQPSVLWRAVVLSTGGIILCWSLLMSLWLPWIDYRSSYQPVVSKLIKSLDGTGDCVETNVGASQRALFAYYGQIHFAGFSESNCSWYLLQSSRKKSQSQSLPAHVNEKNWIEVWNGHRSADKDEYFTLFRLAP